MKKYEHYKTSSEAVNMFMGLMFSGMGWYHGIGTTPLESLLGGGVGGAVFFLHTTPVHKPYQLFLQL